MKREIKSFHQRLMSIKMLTIDHLEKCKIAVKKVVFLLKSMLAADEHTVFLEEKHKSLHESADHWELFGLLSPYCNYLSPDLLDQLIEQLTQLIKELTLEENSFETVSKRMKTYKTDLQKFRQRTTLQLFCDANTSAEDYPPPGFTKIVTEHEWPAKVTLEYVERFRKRYVHAYNLRKCAMMLNNIGTGSFTVTWFVPVTVIDILREKRAVKVYKEFKVSRLKIYVQATAVCVYQTPVQRKVSLSHID